MNSRWLIRAVAASAIAGTLALNGCSETKPAATPAAAAPNAATPSAQPAAVAEEEVIASGPIVVEQQVEMAAQRDGIVSSITADLGTYVRKGGLLATLDDRQLTADRDAQQAKVRSIEADVKNWEAETRVLETDRDRALAMWKANLITEQNRDHAIYKADAAKFEVLREKENLNQHRAVLQSLELELGKARIVAPFDGVVARRYVTAGQKVARNDRLFWFTATSPMRIRFMMPERWTSRVRPGTTLVVTPATQGATAIATEHAARVVMMSPVVDPASGTVEVIAEITGPTGELRPGMTANVRLGSGKK